MSPRDKSDRDVILGRRRLFVASAMATIATTQTACDALFRPCLEPAVRADAEPTMCLSVPLGPRDASVSIVSDAGPDADVPRPCLSQVVVPPDAGRDAAAKEPPRPPQPLVCLSPVPPRPCLKPVKVD
ncbi:MAG: hypothetical protein HYZ29_14520 [Myxococcales bacterium]|nr:hypothetical protein [Myxococcales bacterium]